MTPFRRRSQDRAPRPQRCIFALVAGLLFIMAPCAPAQTGVANYPSRAIRFILPFPPGGGTDILGRLLAQKLSEEIGQPVVPENRPGAGGNVGNEAAAKAPPDGYTVVICTTSLAVSKTLYKKLGYDPEKDLAPIGLVASNPQVLLASGVRQDRRLAGYASQVRGRRR